jgi:hypothetical protein
VNELRGTEFNPALRDALDAFNQYPDRQAARVRIAERIPSVPAPRGAGFLAVWLGGGVENGADPEPAIPHLVTALLKWSRTISLPENDEDSAGEAVADEETLAGLEWLGQGLVAHLARCPAARAAYATREDVLAELERVEQVSVGCLWVRELLSKRSGTLIVIHVAGRKGVRVGYENISKCFHLFTLLQAALAGRMPGARRVPAGTVAIARGERDGEASDSAWWHYGPGTVPEANVVASIWGEAGPESIPAVDGEQVMLLWPPQLAGRSWDANFFLPRIEAAPARVHVIEDLSPEELGLWWAKLKLSTAVPKPWWRLW